MYFTFVWYLVSSIVVSKNLENGILIFIVFELSWLRINNFEKLNEMTLVWRYVSVLSTEKGQYTSEWFWSHDKFFM
jgi:hypothetical protein